MQVLTDYDDSPVHIVVDSFGDGGEHLVEIRVEDRHTHWTPREVRGFASALTNAADMAEVLDSADPDEA